MSNMHDNLYWTPEGGAAAGKAKLIYWRKWTWETYVKNGYGAGSKWANPHFDVVNDKKVEMAKNSPALAMGIKQGAKLLS